MSTYYLDLLGEQEKHQDFLYGTFAHVFAKNLFAVLFYDREYPAITPEARTFTEFDHYLKQLEDEIRVLRRKAKHHFETGRRKW